MDTKVGAVDSENVDRENVNLSFKRDIVLFICGSCVMCSTCVSILMSKSRTSKRLCGYLKLKARNQGKWKPGIDDPRDFIY